MLWSLLLFYVLIILIVNFILPYSQRHGIYAKLLYGFTSLILVALLLFRGDVGVDWESGYVLYYEMATNLYELFSNGLYLGLSVEPGFQIYLSLLKSLSFHQNWVPTGLLIFILYRLYLNCLKYNFQYVIVIALFTLLNYLHFYEQIRMAVVYSFGILIFTTYTYNKNKINTKLVFLSGLIQYVSLFYFILFYIFKFLSTYRSSILIPRYTQKIIMVFKVGLFLILSFFLGDRLFHFIDQTFYLFGTDFFIVEKYLSYSSRSADLDNQISYNGSILLFLMATSFIFFYKTNEIYLFHINKKYAIFLFLSIAIFLIFNRMPVLSHRLVGMILIPSFIILGNIYFQRTRNISLFFLLFLYAVLKYFSLTKEIGDYKVNFLG